MSIFSKKPDRIYLDHASTTPLSDSVVAAMKPYFQESFYNPSSLYQEAGATKEAVRDARKSVAEVIHARSEEVYFTGSGTESDNLAIKGVWEAARETIDQTHIVTTTIEHPAILETCRMIEKKGGEVTYVPVKENGIVDPADIVAACKETTVLVSVMLANNEIGTIQPIAEISRRIKKEREKQGWVIPYIHTDASQAPNYLSVSVQALGVDLMTLDSSKIYGPKGVGMLFVRHGVAIEPVVVGGGQERGLRAGTENVPGIIGFAAALKEAEALREQELERLLELQKFFISEVMKQIPEAHLNGDPDMRLPNNINICIPKLNSEFAVIQLDHEGVACASMSACKHLGDASHSYVIEALGEQGATCKESSIRFTMGRSTTKKDIQETIERLVDILPKNLR